MILIFRGMAPAAYPEPFVALEDTELGFVLQLFDDTLVAVVDTLRILELL